MLPVSNLIQYDHILRWHSIVIVFNLKFFLSLANSFVLCFTRIRQMKQRGLLKVRVFRENSAEWSGAVNSIVARISSVCNPTLLLKNRSVFNQQRSRKGECLVFTVFAGLACLPRAELWRGIFSEQVPRP